MSAAQAKDAGLCGVSLRHWALSTSCASAIYFAVMTVLAIWARWTVGSLAFAVEQEGSEVDAWSSPKLVGIILAVTFSILALLSAYLAFRVYSKPEENLNSITRTWRVLLVAVVLGSFCCIAGAVMAFGSAKSAIEAGCKAIDTQCFATYEVIQWVSIFFEVAGVALLIATLFTVRHYRHDLGSSSSPDGDTAKSKQSLLGSTSKNADLDSSYSLRHSDRSSRKKRRSRRADLAGEYSMSKKSSRRSRRDEYDELYDKPRGRSHSRSRSRRDRDAPVSTPFDLKEL
ncbi:hypothetical protein RTBOTA2_002010 [Rhodotorula toruloides]|nr:hypothetical protein RTBOTA2_002010 [Rhodotorula toruloides]